MKKELRQFIIGAIIVSLATTAGYLIAPIEVRFISSLTNNPTLVGLTYGIGTLFFALLSIWLGRLSDTRGRNKFIIIGCALGVVYPLLYASTYNIFQYMGARLVWAISSVATGPIFMAYLQDILKNIKKKGQYIGIMFSAQAVLGAGASFIGGYLSDKFGLATPYIIMAFLFALATLISLWVFKFKPKKARTNTDKRSLFFGLRYLFKKPALVFYFIHNTSFSINWGIKTMLWPLIIFGMTQQNTMTGSVFATMGIVAFFMLLFIGRVADKIGGFATANRAMFLLGITGLVLVLTKNFYVFWIFAAIYAIGEAMYGPAQAVILTDNVESKYRGEILGLDAVLDKISITIAPVLAGLLLTIWHPQLVLLVYIILFWISLVIGNSILVKRTRKNTA